VVVPRGERRNLGPESFTRKAPDPLLSQFGPDRESQRRAYRGISGLVKRFRREIASDLEVRALAEACQQKM
jgi:hypothetical protein